MLRAYVEIPSKACREVDPNHMILGMRWAWISDPDLATGWENFDVFSINCYAVDPTEAISHVVELGVDLPVMIGEFHFGALDRGLSATGLEGVLTQKDRGKAYRYYCEVVSTSAQSNVGAATISSAMISLFLVVLTEKIITLVCLTFAHVHIRIWRLM